MPTDSTGGGQRGLDDDRALVATDLLPFVAAMVGALMFTGENLEGFSTAKNGEMLTRLIQQSTAKGYAKHRSTMKYTTSPISARLKCDCGK